MALSFKRSQKIVEDFLPEVYTYLENYGPGKVQIEIDWELAKSVSGTTTNWTNNEQKNKNEICLLYLKEQGLKDFYCFVADICKDDFGKEAWRKLIEKVVIKVDDKGAAKQNQHIFSVIGKVLEWQAHLDFSIYVCQNLPSETIDPILKFFNEKADLDFLRAKKSFEEGMSWNKSRLDGVFPKQEVVFEWDGMKAIKGTTPHEVMDKILPRNSTAVKYLQDNIHVGFIMALEKVGNDDLGKEAINETFQRFVIRVDDKSKGGSVHEVSKQGSDLIFTSHLDFDGVLQSYPDGEIAKKKLSLVC